MKCLICNREFSSTTALCVHLSKTHKIKAKNYYDTYFKKNNEGYCLVCRKPTLFKSLLNGYNPYCSKDCANHSPLRIEKIKKTTEERYGVSSIFKRKDVREKCEKAANSSEARAKAKATTMKHYGVEHPMHSEKVKNKIKSTNLEKYGVEHTFQSDNNKTKSKKTMIEKYGVDHNFKRQEIIDIAKEASHTPEVIAKRKETNIERYGVSCLFKLPEVQEKAQTNAHTPEAKAKQLESMKKTNLEIYGVENQFQRPEVQAKTAIAAHSEKANQNRKNTMQERYGIDYTFQLESVQEKAHSREAIKKQKETKLKNGTFNSSKPEKEFLEKMLQLYPDTIDEYKSKRYPYFCDFYIPSLDLFIELNLFFTHGGHFYEGSDEDLKIIEKWSSSQHSILHRGIQVWTQSDIIKRDCAIKNKLNYVVLWNKSQIELFFDLLSKDQKFIGFNDFNNRKDK